jgi:hypothetical protein
MGEALPVSRSPGRAAIVTAFDPERFSGGIERFTVQLADLLALHGWVCDVLHTEDGEATPGFANRFLGSIHALGQRVARGRYDLVVCNNFYGLSDFPPRARTVTVFHATHAGSAESVGGIVDRRMYLEWRTLWGDLGDRLSGLGRKLVAVVSETVAAADVWWLVSVSRLGVPAAAVRGGAVPPLGAIQVLGRAHGKRVRYTVLAVDNRTLRCLGAWWWEYDAG